MIALIAGTAMVTTLIADMLEPVAATKRLRKQKLSKAKLQNGAVVELGEVVLLPEEMEALSKSGATRILAAGRTRYADLRRLGVR